MKKIAKTVAALALTFTATACDPSQVLNGAGPVPCNPNQGDHYTAAAGQDGHNSGAVLNSGGPIVDPDHNDKF